MFTIEQIKAAHSKVKSGADFPKYVQELIRLGVTHYNTYVSDGHTDFFGKDDYQLSSASRYELLIISEKVNGEKFQNDLKEHQGGKTDYPTFCKLSAASGIYKWEVCMEKMTCTYFDSKEENVLVETIPV